MAEKIEVVQVKADQFEGLCRMVKDNKDFVEKYKDKLDGLTSDSQRIDEFNRRMADMEDAIRLIREASANNKILSSGYGWDCKVTTPAEALIYEAGDSKDPYEAKIREWQQRADLVYLGTILDGTPKFKWLSEKIGTFDKSKFFLDFQKETKAMYEGSGNVGADWVPTILSADLFREIKLALKVAALHPSFPMTSKTVEVPAKSGNIYAEYINESVSDSSDKITAKTPSSRKVQFNAKKFGIRTLTSSELEEDSIVPTLMALREDIIYALATAQEYAIINGDTAGTQDSTDQNGDTIHSKSNLKAWNGYRKILKNIGGPIISSQTTLTAANCRVALASMGKFAADITRLSWVTNVRGMFKHFCGLGNIQTLDKLGPKAVLLSGQLGAYMGAPIVVSEWHRDDVGISGYSGGASGKAYTSVLLVNRDSFRTGDRRAIKIETEKDIDTDQIKIVGTRRLDFQNMYSTASTNTILAEIKGLR